ncbi:MAG: hypothetical protein WC703_10580, partial [Candidatus Neomarinimicrobiota bacterium]
ALSADCLIFFARNMQISADGIINAHIQHSSSVSFCVICGLSHILRRRQPDIGILNQSIIFL